MDQSRFLQPSDNLGHAFAAHAQHVGDQFLRQRISLVAQPVQA